MDSLINLIYTEGDLELTIVKIIAFLCILEFFSLVVSFLGRIGRK